MEHFIFLIITHNYTYTMITWCVCIIILNFKLEVSSGICKIGQVDAGNPIWVTFIRGKFCWSIRSVWIRLVCLWAARTSKFTKNPKRTWKKVNLERNNYVVARIMSNSMLRTQNQTKFSPSIKLNSLRAQFCFYFIWGFFSFPWTLFQKIFIIWIPLLAILRSQMQGPFFQQ